MKGLVLVPTYNESGNITRLLQEILGQGLDVDVLVVDDNSPDGTGALVEDFAKRDPRVRLMSRKGPKGRGVAGIDGFKVAVASSADYVVEMDADFSHDPAFLPRFLPALENADAVIASRMVPGGSAPDRSLRRRLTTLFACGLIRVLLGVPVRDATSGFRCFRRQALAKLDWDRFVSVGPSIVEELLWALQHSGARMVEIPLVFLPRAAGRSQLTFGKLLDTLGKVSVFRFKSPPIKN